MKTRRLLGVSIDRAESAVAVTEAFRDAVKHGVPASWYADRGPGQKAQAFEAILERLGVNIERSIPRRSQSRGLAESFCRRLVALARRYPTCINSKWTPTRNASSISKTRRDLRETGTSRLLPPWEIMEMAVAEEREAYNRRPHRGLPRIVDPATGRKRYQTPDEAWAEAIAAGWSPITLDEDELADHFREYHLRVTRRGEVRAEGLTYFLRELEHLDGGEVLVGVDPRDSSRVWVRDTQERLVGIALLDGNHHPYFTPSRIDAAREKRARAREKRLVARINNVRAELAQAPGAPPVVRALQPTESFAEVIGRSRRSSADPEQYLLSKIRTAGAGGISQSALQRTGAQRMGKDAREGALAALAERGEIRIERARAAEAKKPTTLYVAAQLDAPRAAVVNLRTKPAALPYEDDEFFARARWLERRQAAGEPLDQAEARWLEVARTEPWYIALLRMEKWHARLEAKAAG